MEIGTKVRVIDGSYSLRLTNNGFTNTGNIVDFKTYKLLFKDMKLPCDNRHDPNYTNDAIIKDVSSGEVYFTQLRFLREIPEHKEMTLAEIERKLGFKIKIIG